MKQHVVENLIAQLNCLSRVSALEDAPYLSCIDGTAIGRVSIERATRAMIPFYATMVVVLILITFIPDLVMFIPNRFMP